jgi:uncharacterized protein (TIGR03067 family)
MRRLAPAGILLAAASLAFAPAPFLRKPDLGELYGVWKGVSVIRPTGTTAVPGATFAHFEGNTLTFRKEPKGGAAASYRIVINTGVTPPTIDLYRQPEVKGGPTPTFRGIFRIQGDTLEFAYKYSGSPGRPTGFKPGEKEAVMTFRRHRGP